MSLETLFLLALFILLPLIERLLRSARERSEGAPDRAPNVPSPARRPSRPRPTPQVEPPVDVAAPRTASVPPLPVEPAAREKPGPQPPAPGARRPARRRNVVEDLRHPSTLRRAVVLMTVLGPCRSVAPHDWQSQSPW